MYELYKIIQNNSDEKKVLLVIGTHITGFNQNMSTVPQSLLSRTI